MHPVDLQTTALAIISRNQQCHSSAAACSFSREQNTVSTCRALTSPASPACPNPHSVLRHHSPAALLSRYLLTRFRALALFGRRPGERVVSSRRRAAENLTNTGPALSTVLANIMNAAARRNMGWLLSAGSSQRRTLATWEIQSGTENSTSTDGMHTGGPHRCQNWVETR